MTIDLYYTTDEPAKVSKSLTAVSSGVSMTPKGNLDIMAPLCVLAYNTAYLAANYAYIGELGRYYFISDMVLSPGSQIVLQLELDALMSWSAGIRASEGVVVRSESIGSTYMPDDKYPIDPRQIWLESIPLSGHTFTTPADGDRRYLIAVNATY